MGAQTSTNRSNDVDYAIGTIYSTLTNAKCVAQLSWDDFVSLIAQLNIRCRELADDKGKYLLFALKKGTSDSLLWKATVRICCLKMRVTDPDSPSTTHSIEARRTLTLSEFLRSAQALQSIIDQRKGMVDVGNDALIADHLSQVSDMSASMILDEIVHTTSSGTVDGVSNASDLHNECIVCMERRPDVVLSCSHCYCRPCIEQWKECCIGAADSTQPMCPLCRTQIAASADDKNEWVLVDERPHAQNVTDYMLTMTDG